MNDISIKFTTEQLELILDTLKNRRSNNKEWDRKQQGYVPFNKTLDENLSVIIDIILNELDL